MNHDDKQRVKSLMEKDQYYREAQRWFWGKYLHPISQQFFTRICLLLTLIIVVIVGITFIPATGTISPTPFLFDHDDLESQTPKMKFLGENNTSAEDAFARYLIEHYLTLREEYLPSIMYSEEYRFIQNQIKSSSMKSVLREYKNYMNRRNPNSPFIRLGKFASRQITVDEFSFIGQNRTSGKAKIIFTATEKNTNNNEETVQRYEANIHFRLANIYDTYEAQSPLSFAITRYRVKAL